MSSLVTNLSNVRHDTLVRALTLAVLTLSCGVFPIKAISPKNSPDPRVRISLPSWSTTTRPSLIMKNVSPNIDSNNSALPYMDICIEILIGFICVTFTSDVLIFNVNTNALFQI